MAAVPAVPTALRLDYWHICTPSSLRGSLKLLLSLGKAKMKCMGQRFGDAGVAGGLSR